MAMVEAQINYSRYNYLDCSTAGPTDLLTIVQMLNIMLIVRHLLTIMFTQSSCIDNLQVENV